VEAVNCVKHINHLAGATETFAAEALTISNVASNNRRRQSEMKNFPHKHFVMA
jgi:hypothetical protein